MCVPRVTLHRGQYSTPQKVEVPGVGYLLLSVSVGGDLETALNNTDHCCCF